MSSLAELEQALAGFTAGFEQMGMPGCPIGTLATEVAGRNEEARVQAAAGFDAWERLLADVLERMRQRRGTARGRPARHAGHRVAGQHRGRMVLSQARQDMTSLRVAVETGLAHVRTYAS